MTKKKYKPGCCNCGCSWHPLISFMGEDWCRRCLYEVWECGLISNKEALAIELIDDEDIKKRLEKRKEAKNVN